MNKHKRAAIIFITIIFICAYFTLVPFLITHYGINNNIPAFDNGAPFGEVYSVFSLVWIIGNLVTLLILVSLYMLCYGCHDNSE